MRRLAQVYEGGGSDQNPVAIKRLTIMEFTTVGQWCSYGGVEESWREAFKGPVPFGDIPGGGSKTEPSKPSKTECSAAPLTTTPELTLCRNDSVFKGVVLLLQQIDSEWASEMAQCSPAPTASNSQSVLNSLPGISGSWTLLQEAPHPFSRSSCALPDKP